MLHRAESVREAALGCLEAAQSCMAALGEKVTYESRTVRKILKVSERRLLLGDRLFLLQAPYNHRILGECAKELGLDVLLSVEAPADGVERRAWLYGAASALELLVSGALSPLLSRFPELPERIVDLLGAHKPRSSEGGVLWRLWRAEMLSVLPSDLRDRALDTWLEVASLEGAGSALRSSFCQLALSAAQAKRLMAALLPRKSAVSAKEMILRRR